MGTGSERHAFDAFRIRVSRGACSRAARRAGRFKCVECPPDSSPGLPVTTSSCDRCYDIPSLAAQSTFTGGSSHLASQTLGRVAIQSTTNKSNTPSNVGAAPKFNPLANPTSVQLSSKVVGSVDKFNPAAFKNSGTAGTSVGPAPHTILHANPMLKLKDTGARVTNGMNNV